MYTAQPLGILLAAISLGFLIYGLAARSRPITVLSIALVAIAAVVVALLVYASGITVSL